MPYEMVKCPMCGHEEFDEIEVILPVVQKKMIFERARTCRSYSCKRCGFVALFRKNMKDIKE